MTLVHGQWPAVEASRRHSMRRTLASPERER
jgi:hypothetical protein